MLNSNVLEIVNRWENQFEENEQGNRENDTYRRWYSFKLDAIKSTNEDYLILSNILQESSVDHNTGYEWIVGILADLSETMDNEQTLSEEFDAQHEGWGDNISEYADNEVPIYNHSLTQWLAKGNNWILVDEAVEEYGWNDEKGTIGAIQLGYFKGIKDMYYRVLEELEKKSTEGGE